MLPNLLIIGAQKCGTTWLHSALSKSDHFWGSKPKELTFWNKRDIDIERYKVFFKDAPADKKFIFEATPHYFRLPKAKIDVAARIREGLGDIPLILILRNPVDRYLSAHTHHMMKSRIPYSPVIESPSDEFGMMSLGLYHAILKHYKSFFSKIHVYLYDDLISDPVDFVNRVFSDLALDSDLEKTDLNFRVNDKNRKMARLKRSGGFSGDLPVLSEPAKAKLVNFYRKDVWNLYHEFDLACDHWVS